MSCTFGPSFSFRRQVQWYPQLKICLPVRWVWKHRGNWLASLFQSQIASSTSTSISSVAVPWARPGSGFTLLFEALILTLVQDLPVKALARLIGEHDTRIWRVLRHYIDEARGREEYKDVHRIGIDETARKRGHQYVSLFVNLDPIETLWLVLKKRFFNGWIPSDEEPLEQRVTNAIGYYEQQPGLVRSACAITTYL
ncbi:MAG TPA: DDE transposase [Bacteroidetes bacterium]|nr:DDE transposase [Bacteroidota bacterium]HEX05003.1 DDE transposase [Bacteroidota bacterium]